MGMSVLVMMMMIVVVVLVVVVSMCVWSLIDAGSGFGSPSLGASLVRMVPRLSTAATTRALSAWAARVARTASWGPARWIRVEVVGATSRGIPRSAWRW